jgi:hypothetical protein
MAMGRLVGRRVWGIRHDARLRPLFKSERSSCQLLLAVLRCVGIVRRWNGSFDSVTVSHSSWGRRLRRRTAADDTIMHGLMGLDSTLLSRFQNVI